MPRRGATGGEHQITAVPKLLDMLDVEGHTVSLDAMGCQKKIARKLHLAHADYLLAVKGNHPHLHERLEKRVVLATDALGWIDKMERESWLGLECFLCVDTN